MSSRHCLLYLLLFCRSHLARDLHICERVMWICERKPTPSILCGGVNTLLVDYEHTWHLTQTHKQTQLIVNTNKYSLWCKPNTVSIVCSQSLYECVHISVYLTHTIPKYVFCVGEDVVSLVLLTIQLPLPLWTHCQIRHTTMPLLAANTHFPIGLIIMLIQWVEEWMDALEGECVINRLQGPWLQDINWSVCD